MATAVVYNHFPQSAKALHTSLKKMVRLTAEELAAEIASNAPVDTGLLQDSVYVTGAGGGSTYGKINPEAKLTKNKSGVATRKRIQNYVKRRARHAKRAVKLFSEIAPPPEDTEALVPVAAMYGVFVELGTSKMAAQPYFYPAVEYERPLFEARASELEANMKANGA